MKKQDEEFKIAASVTIHRVPDMSNEGRTRVCQWLRRLAMDVQKHPDVFSTVFRAHYRYAVKEQK